MRSCGDAGPSTTCATGATAIGSRESIDAALGVIERGTWQIADAVAAQPWLPNGPIPTQVIWAAHEAPAAPAQPQWAGLQPRGPRVSTAMVVGAGPNGLAAAITLARTGVQVTVAEADDDIGGGTRSSEAIQPGLIHDHCSAIHPMAVGSPFLRELDLDRYGLSWRLPDIDCVCPAGTSARPPPRPVPVRTACAATTPPNPH